MPSRPGCLLLLGLTLAVHLGATGVPGPALPLFDAYLAEAARTVTAYRADIRIGADLKDAGPGRLEGESAFLGRFTFRPVTFAELSRTERARLVHDPQFRAFLQKLGQPAPLPTDFEVTITPAEMLRSGPFDVVLRK
jgi:hypothetical protein